MWQKTYFLVALVFFLVMNILLWRSQYGRRDLSLPIPVETVTRRMVSATDDSNLEILRDGIKIGYCRWSPQTISRTATTSGETTLPEGMIGNITGYNLSFDGTVMIAEFDRVRFNIYLQLDTNFVWQTVNAQLATPTARMDVFISASQEFVQIKTAMDDQTKQRSYTFQELQDPQAILRGLGGGLLVQALSAAGLAFPATSLSGAALGLDWEGSTDRQRLGTTSFPVYRLQTTILDEYPLRAIVLPSGELLRVELPGDITLINDNLSKM